MPMSFFGVDEKHIISIKLDGMTQLSSELVARLGAALDQAEDLGPASSIFLHLVGCSDERTSSVWPGQPETQLITKWERLLRRLERISNPSVCLVEHYCTSVALELLLVTDWRVANSSFAFHHAGQDGKIWPSMAVYRLCRQIGEARTRKFLLESGNVTATKAIKNNIVDEIVSDLTDGPARIVRFLKLAPLKDFAVRRRLMQDSSFSTFDESLSAHLAACARSLQQ